MKMRSGRERNFSDVLEMGRIVESPTVVGEMGRWRGPVGLNASCKYVLILTSFLSDKSISNQLQELGG